MAVVKNAVLAQLSGAKTPRPGKFFQYECPSLSIIQNHNNYALWKTFDIEPKIEQICHVNTMDLNSTHYRPDNNRHGHALTLSYHPFLQDRSGYI